MSGMSGISRIGYQPYDPMMQMYGAGRFYGPQSLYSPYMMRGFQTPIDQMQARYYHHEMATEGMVKGAVGGALGGAATGAAIGAFGGLPGIAIGAVAGGVLGLIGGALGGRSIGGMVATHHDAEDDGVLNGSPLEYGGGHA